MKYIHKEIAFLTQHGKDQLLQPLFKNPNAADAERADPSQCDLCNP